MPYAMMLIVAPLLVAVIGIVVERFILRRVHHHGPAHEMLVTFGLAYIVQEVIKLFFGNNAVDYRAPASMTFSAFTLFGTSYPFYRTLIAIVAGTMFAVIFALLRFTRVGIVVRAAVHQPAMVEALGHNVPFVFLMVFGLGAWLAGMAGAIGGAILVTNPNMAVDLGIIVFVVVVVGGLGSLEGAFLASILIGVLTTLSAGIQVSVADLLSPLGLSDWATGLGSLMTVKLATFSAAVPVLIMLIVLLTRPAGLMGDRH
jgi:branched-chain amino acid transport system permease protein